MTEKARRNKGYFNVAKQRRYAFIAWLKSAPCADCGKSYPPYVMDFDHVRGIKAYNVGTLLTRNTSWVALMEELMKCEIVCSNCHRERTHVRKEKK